MAIGIMGAMEEEVAGLLEAMEGRQVRTSGGRAYHRGRLFGAETVVVFSRWGKVAAASTATHLLVAEGVEAVIFTGVAGAADPALHVGDVVVASELWQHDMDARPLYARHEIPLLGTAALSTPDAWRKRAAEAARRFLADPPPGAADFGIRTPKVVEGAVASGDKFFASRAEIEEVRSRIPGLSCVEMEGAAVMQVCHEHGVPGVVIRTISDSADEGAPTDFARFVREVASRYSAGILRELISSRSRGIAGEAGRPERPTG